MNVVSEIFNTIDEIRQNCAFDTEASSIHYLVRFNLDNVIALYEVSKYHDYGDEWGQVDVSTNIALVSSIEGQTLKDYCNLLADYIRCEQELKLRFGKIYDLIRFENVGE